MGLKLRGNAWYLRKMVDGKAKEFPLGLYGGEADRKRAEKAAEKMRRQVDEAVAAAKMLARLGLGQKAEAPVAVPTFAERWARDQKAYAASKKPKVVARDAVVVARWMALPCASSGLTWGETPLDRFVRSDCESAMTLRRASLQGNPGRRNPQAISESTVRRERGVIQGIFSRAIADRVIAHNPFAGIKRGKDKPRHRLLLEAAQPAVLAEMSDTFRRFCEFVLETGLRLDEVQNLDANRSVHGGHLHVPGKSRVHHEYCPVCKLQDMKCRDIPLTARAQQILTEQMVAEGQLWPQTPARIREVLALAAKRAGLRDPKTGDPMTLSPHDLRHTYGHRWLTRGGDIYTLSKLLGHKTIKTTEDHYAYLLREDLTAKVQAVMGAR